MSKKTRIYLDTSAISYLDQTDTPNKMIETQKVWEVLQTNNYEIVISNIALLEISKCSKTKAQTLANYIDSIDYLNYELDQNTEILANLIIEEGVLTPKSKNDALHIASAILSNCDIILSWNFKHLVNVSTINGIRKLCFNKNIHKRIDILSPNILLKGDGNNDKT